ncbi:MAG: hypothetical protein GTN89_16875, partial [Acidobacteria bacterium]|nr:hypothetical protein [Acidobacteriota bacterium]NIO60957.1 hypothetical protein [Acidobacteriota bacterium]NIQ31970.1 hypothetical protein [Acidobacteriota bacterium]NIQ87455.1 hypothetical protein [Acidobacteriota bacterium]
KPDPARLDWIHRHKTAALLAASTELGAIHAGAAPDACAAMAEYGLQIGLAFQIADDILDCTSTAADLGKTPGKDRAAGKATFPALYGLERSRKHAADAIGRAIAAVERVGLLEE